MTQSVREWELERAAAVEALKPFHKLHDDVLRGRDYVPDDAALVLTTLDGGIIDTSDRIEAGHLRRAREAYQSLTIDREWPMDFEKEAREIVQGHEPTMYPNLRVDLANTISKALRRVYAAGQKDMRERASDTLNSSARGLVAKKRTNEHDRYGSWLLSNHREKILALPLLSPDHEKVG